MISGSDGELHRNARADAGGVNRVAFNQYSPIYLEIYDEYSKPFEVCPSSEGSSNKWRLMPHFADLDCWRASSCIFIVRYSDFEISLSCRAYCSVESNHLDKRVCSCWASGTFRDDK